MASVRYKGRVGVLATVVVVVFVGIAVRLSALHLRPAEWVLEPIEKARRLDWTPVGSRGRIVDRNGEILAMDVSGIVFHVGVDPEFISQHGDPELLCRILPSELDVPEQELRADLAQTNRQYVVVKNYVPAAQLKKFHRGRSGHWIYADAEAGSGGETNRVLKGLVIDEVPIRKYPNGPLMAHVLGFSNREGQGSAGIEYRMNAYLCGKEGRRISKRDGRNREIYSERELDIPPRDGATVELTLDSWLQYQVEKTIEKTCTEFNAQAVWAIVQCVRTGEILAMASFPTYDPNRYGDAPEEWRRNRAIGFNYEPGSTMKAAVIASALDHGIVKENDLIDCEKGYWVYGGKALRDSHGEGIIPVEDVIKFSSNIGTAKIALMMGDDLLYRSLRGFHFGQRLDVGLPGEEGGIFYAPGNWSKISITRIGMGQEIAATALQILSMMNAIAYNGVQMKPYLVKRVVDPDGTVLEEFNPSELGRPLTPAAARRMQRLLSRVTEEEGTGTKARVEGYTVAGKTGTAQKINPAGGYFAKNFTSSFVGFLPAENPEIGIIVVADDPGIYKENGQKIGYYGGTVCGPAFKEIAEFAVRYLRIGPDGNRVYVARPEE